MITEPTAVFALLAALAGAIFWFSTLTRLSPVFKYLPPVIWIYFVPMILTTLGITPSDNAFYTWAARYLLPFSLFLLMVTVDLPAVLRLGPKALGMMLAGTAGIIIGGPLAYLLFQGFLPDDAWQGLASLSGSWIGGTANMVAIQQHIQSTYDTVVDLGPIIVVDTVVGYGWMGTLIVLSAFQGRFDRWIKADTTLVDNLNKRLLEMDTGRRPITLPDLAIIVGIGMAATELGRLLGDAIPPVRLAPDAPSLISGTTWAILIVVTAGLALSFTRIRKIEQAGASRVGYLALYLLLTTIGARADLKAVLDAPLYLLTGAVWISIHILFLFLMARLLRSPMFLVAIGSMANVGGAASAPVVAEVYRPAMAPVGLLMAVAGYALGIYGALVCAWMFAAVGGG